MTTLERRTYLLSHFQLQHSCVNVATTSRCAITSNHHVDAITRERCYAGRRHRANTAAVSNVNLIAPSLIGISNRSIMGDVGALRVPRHGLDWAGTHAVPSERACAPQPRRRAGTCCRIIPLCGLYYYLQAQLSASSIFSSHRWKRRLAHSVRRYRHERTNAAHRSAIFNVAATMN